MPDQNEELERIVTQLVVPVIRDGRRRAEFRGERWEARMFSGVRNLNQGILNITFYGEWSAKHFRGFYPTAALRNLPFTAKHSKGNHQTEKDRSKWADTTTIFFQFAQVIAWANLQDRRHAEYEQNGRSVKACRDLAYAHGVRYLFIDEDGNVPLRLVESRDGDVCFATHKLGEGYVFRVNPHTGAVRSERARIFDLEANA